MLLCGKRRALFKVARALPQGRFLLYCVPTPHTSAQGAEVRMKDGRPMEPLLEAPRTLSSSFRSFSHLERSLEQA